MKNIQSVSKAITNCTRCPRLANYTRQVAATKVRRFKAWDYWGRPVPGYGDVNARVHLIGLAPAAHGANRTGRMFTGDSSGDWLYRALYETGFASQPESISIEDGMQLSDVFISAVCRCAPPNNKPLPLEILNCAPFLQREMELLDNVKVVVCLGQLAFNRYCRMRDLKGLAFAHGEGHAMAGGRTLVTSYHPSRQNTNTGKLKWNDWLRVFSEVRDMVKKMS